MKLRIFLLAGLASFVARAEFAPVARLDVMSVPMLAADLGGYLEAARLIESPQDAQAMAKHLFLLPELYEMPQEPASCHWIYDSQAGASNGLCRVVVIPARNRGESLVTQLRGMYRRCKTRDGFFFFDGPQEALPPLVLFCKANQMWISTSQKALIWAALNEQMLLPSPQETSGAPLLAVNPANLLAYLESDFFKVTPLTPGEALYWVRALRIFKPVIESFQTVWMTITLERMAASVDFRLQAKVFSNIGQILTTWTDPGVQTESYIPARTLFALTSGVPTAATNAPFFGTLGRGMKDFSMYVAETRNFGPYLTYVAEIPDDHLAARLKREMTTFQLIPGTRVVPTQSRTLRQGPEIHTFHLESLAPAGNFFAAPLQLLCSALVGECWVSDRHVFVTLAMSPAAETVVAQGARRGTMRSSTLERVRRGLQKLPDHIRFALISSPSAAFRSVLMVMPGAEASQLRGASTIPEGLTLVIAEERYSFLRIFVQLNSNELSTIRELIDRGQPVLQNAGKEIQKQRATK